MLRKFLLIFYSLFILFCAPLLAMEDAIIAVVNDNIITLRDLREYLNSVYSQLRIEGRTHEEIESVMLNLETEGINRLIEDKLLVTEANAQGLEVKQDVVTQKVDEIKNRYSSEQDFLDSLLSEGNTVTDLRAKIEEQLKVKYIVEQEVRSRIFVNPQEVTDYYKSHFDEFQKGERVELQSIFVSSAENPDQAEDKIQTVYALLAEQGVLDNVFEELASEYSEAPSIGIIEKGQMLPVIEDAVFQLHEGEISEITEVESGYYIFRLSKKYPMEIAGLEEVKSLIYDKLFNMKFQIRFRSWVEKLKSNAYIDIKE